MKAVIGDMTISNGGILRLNKSLVESMEIKPGDRLIILQDTENSKVSLQIQRGNAIIFLLDDAVVKNNNNKGALLEEQI